MRHCAGGFTSCRSSTTCRRSRGCCADGWPTARSMTGSRGCRMRSTRPTGGSATRHAHIGPSYFLRDDLDEEAVRMVWEYGVKGYLAEQLIDQEERLESEFGLD